MTRFEDKVIGEDSITISAKNFFSEGPFAGLRGTENIDVCLLESLMRVFLWCVYVTKSKNVLYQIDSSLVYGGICFVDVASRDIFQQVLGRCAQVSFFSYNLYYKKLMRCK